MPNFQDLKENYAKAPRFMDPLLESIVHERAGKGAQMPFMRLLIFSLILFATASLASNYWDIKIQLTLFIALPIFLGGGIGLIRASSPLVQVANHLKKAPVVLGKVVQADGGLYKAGEKPGMAYVLFSTEEELRFDERPLKDLAKKLRSASQAKEPPGELKEALTLLREPVEACLKFDEPQGRFWLAAIHVQPQRLPKRKIIDQRLALLAAPEADLVVHL